MCGGSTSFPTDVSLYSAAYLCMTESGLVVIYLCGFELLFSAMKYHLRRNGDYIHFAMNKLSEVEIHPLLLKQLVTSLSKILLDGIGIVVTYNVCYLWCTQYN